MRSRFSSAQLLISCSALAGMMATGTAVQARNISAGTVQTYDIPKQPLGAALNTFAERSGVQIMFDPSVVREKRNNSLSGRYRVNVALTQMLRGSGLKARPRADGTIIVAQASPATSEGNVRRAPASEAEAETEPAGIGEIVVTASRRAENVQKAALSIHAISSEVLTRANVSKPEDLSSVAPGVSVGTAGSYPQVYIRGVGNYGTQAYSESAVAFNLDGVYISRAWATRGMFYDLERVEVLKGPQGTLYGRNASGGAINVITAKPKLGETGGFAEIQAGNYDLIQGTAAVNVPLGATAAVRAAGQIVDRDGYLSDGYNDDKIRSARLQFLWEPTDDVSILINGNYQHTGGHGAGAVLSPQLPGDKFRGTSDPAVTRIIRAQPGLGALLSIPRDDGYLDVDVYAIGAELNWNLGFATLTVLPAYRDSKYRNLSYISSFHSANNEHDRQTSVEIRLGNNDEPLKWVAGAYYFNERQTELDGLPLQRVLQGPSANSTPRFDHRTRSYALFGQATYSLTDTLRVTGGLRYTYERKVLDGLLYAFGFPNAAPPPPCLGGRVFDPQTPSPPLFCRLDIPLAGRLTYNSITYKAGLEFDLAPRSMAYATISTGFKSGGFYSAPPPNTFRPEKLTALEVGVKNRFLDNRLQLNVEGFYWRYRDHQESHIGPTTIPSFFAFVTENAGRAESYGADIDLAFRPTDRDQLNLKVQYNKTKYNKFEYSYPTASFGNPIIDCAIGPLVSGSQTIDCSGKSLIRAPKWSGTASYSHTFDIGGNGEVTATADVQFASASMLSIEFLQSMRQDAYAIGNFDLTYTSPGSRWTVSAFVRNIWNEAVITNVARSPFVNRANPLANPDGFISASIRPPRTFGGRVRYNF